MIEESKYSSDVMKNYREKELVMAKEDYKNFKNSELRLNSGWICDSDYGDNDVKVRDHCRISGKYRGS